MFFLFQIIVSLSLPGKAVDVVFLVGVVLVVVEFEVEVSVIKADVLIVVVSLLIFS